MSQDALALATRARFNSTAGSFDLGALLRASAAEVPPGLVLDVGAGTGALLWPYIGALPAGCRCVAMDVSEPALCKLRAHSGHSDHNVATICDDMDSLLDRDRHPELEDLAAVFAVYSLYYSSNVPGLLEAVADRLTPRGLVVVAGPAPGNNDGWFDFLGRCSVPIPGWILELGATFFPDVTLPALEKRFSRVEYRAHTNRVTFSNASDLKQYWRSNIYFEPEADDRVCSAIDRHFSSGQVFQIEKSVGVAVAQGLR